MPIDLNAPGPIDPDDPQFAPLLHNLQGNILKSHGREHAVLFFFQFTATGDSLRASLTHLADKYVTSAWHQIRETKEFKQFGIPGGLFGTLLLTSRGYEKLGFTPAALGAALPEAPANPGNVVSNFLEGMEAHHDELNDPDPAAWEPGYAGRQIDALLILADSDEQFLERSAREALSRLDGFATVLAVEHGHGLKNAAGDHIEHFGYVDGRSQPIYLTGDRDAEGSTAQWDPVEPLGRVLVADPLAKHADSFGSFFVFRKLEQDVLHFKIREQEVADALSLTGPDRERAGAMAVGRFEDGTPVVLSPTDGLQPHLTNDFRYGADDPDGLKCPFHAHIRKMNPRGDITAHFPGATEETAERPHRITRRGIPFGTRAKHPDAFQALDDLPSGGVGLLFMCFQSSISQGFAFLQKSWADNEGFVRAGVGLDPVIGQAPAGGPAPAPQNWPTRWGQPGTQAVSFGQFVRMKGGEFFFAPSLPFLKSPKP